MTNAIEIKNVSKKYTDFTLKDISFALPKGSIMGLIGENGAGKSTTIKAILNLISYDGEILFNGKKLSDNIELKEDIGVVFDSINFYEKLSPKKIGNISRAAYSKWNSDKYQSYLSRFRLPENKEISTFSKGMKVKLSIAVALSHDPKILILDEATSGLDPVMRDEILDVFLEFVEKEEHSVLISSHITTDLEKIADYITFINEGQVLFSKKKDELIYSYGIIRCTKKQFEDLEKSDIVSYRKEEYQYSVLTSDKQNAKRKYGDTVIDNATIDDILLLFVKGERIK